MVNTVSLCKALDQFILVFPNAFPEITRHTDVERAVAFAC
jgi:hypothetical protein